MKILKKTLNHFDFFILTCVAVLFVPFFGLSSTIDPVLTPRFLVWSILVFILSVSFLTQLCRKNSETDYTGHAGRYVDHKLKKECQASIKEYCDNKREIDSKDSV